jgi:hypothetical protein
MFQRAKYKEGISLDDIKDPIGSVKYDGGHYFVKFNSKGIPSFISRRQSVKGHYPDRTPNLPQFHGIAVPALAGHVLSAELIHTGHSKDNPESHPVVSGILNSLPHNAIETQMLNGPVRAVLLDVIKPTFKTYGEKLEFLKTIEKKVNKPNIFFVPEFHRGVVAIKRLIQRTKDEGKEGIIVASATTPEPENTRLKIKHKNTYNLKIIGVLQEHDIHGKPKNSTGAFQLGDATDRHVGDVGVGFTREMRQSSWATFEKKWRNRAIQVKAMPPVRPGMKIKMAIFNGDADGDIDTIP